jgi:hypothetical protein
VPGTSYRSPNTATGIRPTSISHAQSEMGAKEPSTTQSLRTGSATGSTIRSWLDGHTREISRESEKLARRPPRANASRTPSQRHWPGSHSGLELNEEARKSQAFGKGNKHLGAVAPKPTLSLCAGSSRLHRGWRGDCSGRTASASIALARSTAATPMQVSVRNGLLPWSSPEAGPSSGRRRRQAVGRRRRAPRARSRAEASAGEAIRRAPAEGGGSSRATANSSGPASLGGDPVAAALARSMAGMPSRRPEGRQ